MKRWIPLIVIAALMVVIWFSGLLDYFTYENLSEQRGHLLAFVGRYPLLAPLLAIFIYFVVVALSLPIAAILSLAMGFLFPHLLATLYIVIGATLGAIAIFLATKTSLGDLMRRKAGPRLAKVTERFHRNAASYLLFLRFIPLFPFWLINLAAGIQAVPLWTFIWTTAVGITPGAYLYAGAGETLQKALGQEMFEVGTILDTKAKIILIALALFSLLPIVIKKIRARREKND